MFLYMVNAYENGFSLPGNNKRFIDMRLYNKGLNFDHFKYL